MAVVVAQLTAWSLPMPEDPGLNTAIGNFYLFIKYFLFADCRKDAKKGKVGGMANLKNLSLRR